MIRMQRFGAGSRLVLLALFLALGGLASRAQDGNGPRPVPVDRVMLRFAVSNITLVSVMSLDKVLPASAELPAVQKPVSGFWYELRSAAGALRYRRIVTDPIRNRFEGVDPSQEGSLPDPRFTLPAERVFALLIPRAAEGDQLVIFSSPLLEGGETLPATEIARITVRDIIIK